MKITKTDTLHRLDIDSRAELVSLKPSAKNADHRARSTAIHESDTLRERLNWYGAENLKAVEHLCSTGWTEGVEKIKELSSRIEGDLPRVRNRKRRARRGRSGDELDIHAVNSGSLDRAWRRTEKVEMKGRAKSKRIRIVVRLGAAWTVPAGQLFFPPATGLILAQRFIKAGFSVEIIGASLVEGLFYGRYAHVHQLLTVMIKRFDQPLNIDALASFALGGLHRHYMFDARGSLTRKIKAHQGYARALRPKHFEANEARTIIIDRCKSEDQAAAIVKAELEKIEKA